MAPFSPHRIRMLQRLLLVQAALGVALLVTGGVLLLQLEGDARARLTEAFLSVIVMPSALLILTAAMLYVRVKQGAGKGIFLADVVVCLLLSPVLLATWVGWVLPAFAVVLLVMTLVPESLTPKV
jgi:hypothetical protein